MRSASPKSCRRHPYHVVTWRHGTCADKVGFRISPFGRYMDSEDADPVATYTHLAARLNDIGILYAYARCRFAVSVAVGNDTCRVLAVGDAFVGL